MTPFPGRVSSPNSFVSLFIFYILSYLLSKTIGCFSGRLISSASDQKLFCGVCSAFNCSFDEFVGEKVVSPSYSSAILALPCSPGLERSPGEGKATPVFWPGEFHELYSPWGCKESDTTEQPSLSTCN